MMRKRKTAVLIVSYVLTAFVVMSGFIYTNYKTAQGYKQQIANNYQHAFSELVSGMNDIDAALQKSLYATSPAMISSICTEIFGKSLSTQMALGELPFSSLELEHTASFISKLGDYAYVLSKSSANGYGEEVYDNLVSLSDTANLLSENLTQLLADINDGVITLEEFSNNQNRLASVDGSVAVGSLGDSIGLMEEEFPEIPQLIYDGPFSEHISNMTPKLIENASEVSEAQARQAAADFMGLKPDIFSLTGMSEGTLPAYYFAAKVDGGEVTIEVTKQGGVVLDMFNSRQVAHSSISSSDAVKIAKNILEQVGYSSMKESYWIINNNVITINFAYVQDGVICYSDLVKVSIGLDNGRLIGFEAMGYVTSHTARDIPGQAVSADEAKSKVSDNLTILSHSMALIPSSGKYEIYCHEFKCSTEDERHYIIYVNAETGEQENILILIENENGTLTM